MDGDDGAGNLILQSMIGLLWAVEEKLFVGSTRLHFSSVPSHRSSVRCIFYLFVVFLSIKRLGQQAIGKEEPSSGGKYTPTQIDPS
ncbi:hypothetical protein L1887_15485 [Cichorium endivia]|nr:hypothetical protein L1887_15485 [Cichorium endivia]